MREIKFRVWTGMAMEYRVVAGLLGSFYVEGLDPEDSACMSKFNTKYSEQAPVMQFTGLKDQNGKEIYEGDIVKYDTEDGICTAKVVCKESEEEGLMLSGFYYEPIELNDYPEGCDDPVYDVIGNIYENPELLK